MCVSFPFITRFISTLFFFFNDTATTEIYTLSLHDALPILNNSHCACRKSCAMRHARASRLKQPADCPLQRSDRKSTRLNSSHGYISYAVFCLKKKKIIKSKKRDEQAKHKHQDERITVP